MKRLTALILLFFAFGQAFAQSLDNEQLLDLIQNQRFREAATYIRSIYPDIITDQKIKSRLAYCNYMSGDLVEAEKTYLSILASDSTNRSALNYLAAINDKRAAYKSAKVFYQRLLRLDTTNITAYKQLATNAEYLRDTAAMFSNLFKANKLNPIDPEVAYDLSKLLIERGKSRGQDFVLADTIISIAIKADPQNILLLNSRLALAHKLEKYKESVAYAKQAIELGDISAQTFNLYGIGNYYLKNYKDCISTFRLMNIAGTATETTYYFTGLAYRQLDSLQRSNEYFEMSILSGISDNIPVYYHELSINNESLKKYRTSISLLDRAETFNPKNIFNYSRARIYDFNLNDPKTALKYYRRYVKEYIGKIDDKESYTYSVQRIKDLTAPAPKVQASGFQ